MVHVDGFSYDCCTCDDNDTKEKEKENKKENKNDNEREREREREVASRTGKGVGGGFKNDLKIKKHESNGMSFLDGAIGGNGVNSKSSCHGGFGCGGGGGDLVSGGGGGGYIGGIVS